MRTTKSDLEVIDKSDEEEVRYAVGLFVRPDRRNGFRFAKPANKGKPGNCSNEHIPGRGVDFGIRGFALVDVISTLPTLVGLVCNECSPHPFGRSSRLESLERPRTSQPTHISLDHGNAGNPARSKWPRSC